MNVKSSRYFLQMETWVKISSIGLATILPPAILFTSSTQADWPRHVATLALLFSWIELMFLLSRFPNGGYYVLMFGKVASNVVKVRQSILFKPVGSLLLSSLFCLCCNCSFELYRLAHVGSAQLNPSSKGVTLEFPLNYYVKNYLVNNIITVSIK